jgi:ribosomal protein S18 acetylase RimI-like enzyme
MHPTVRTATLDDAAVVADLVHRAYRGDSSRVGWTTEADLLDGQRIDVGGVEAKIATPGAVVLVALDDTGRIIGCCEIEHRPGDVAYFGMFAVEPELQAAGLGRTMLEHAEAKARELWDVTTVEMTVILQRAELIAWYERRGYTRTGDTKPFPYGDAAFGLPRTDDLEFVVLAKQLSPGDRR